MNKGIYVLITNLGVVKVQNQSNIDLMTEAENKLQNYFEQIMVLAENTSKSEEDSILLAGAMMGVAQIIMYDHLVPVEADNLMHHNTHDYLTLIKPTIH
jgi:hypothetical protein